VNRWVWLAGLCDEVGKRGNHRRVERRLTGEGKQKRYYVGGAPLGAVVAEAANDVGGDLKEKGFWPGVRVLGWDPTLSGAFTPGVVLGRGVAVLSVVRIFLGGVCFQRLTVITCPKANRVLWRRSV
jgi:hypothetical protein